MHHSGKNASAKGGKYAGRGASQLTDNTSETVAFDEISPGERHNLGDLSALRSGEEQDYIVRAQHTRCSDGKTADTMYLVRNRETGLLRKINVRPKDDGDRLIEVVAENPKFHKWARGLQFSQNTFRTEREQFAPGKLSEADADKCFALAVAGRLFHKDGKRGSGLVYKFVAPDKAEHVGKLAPIPANTANTAKKSTKGGRQHAR